MFELVPKVGQRQCIVLAIDRKSVPYRRSSVTERTSSVCWHSANRGMWRTDCRCRCLYRRWWRQVGRARPGIQEPCCVDIWTPGCSSSPRCTVWIESGQQRRANVEHVAGSGRVHGRTCRCSTLLERLRWGHVAACLLSSSERQPVDPDSSRPVSRHGLRQTHAPVLCTWTSSRCSLLGVHGVCVLSTTTRNMQCV